MAELHRQLRHAQWEALEAAAPELVASGGSPMLLGLAAWRLLSEEPWCCPRARWEQGERLCRAWDRICGRRGAGAVELMWEVVDHLTWQPGDDGELVEPTEHQNQNGVGARSVQGEWSRSRMIGARLVDGQPVDGEGRPTERSGGRPRSLAYFVILLKRRVRSPNGRQAKANSWS